VTVPPRRVRSRTDDQEADTGSEAQAFAKVIRKPTLEATGGQTIVMRFALLVVGVGSSCSR
jgi:hypothetical protein